MPPPPLKYGPARAVYRNFAKGGANLGYGQKRGGACRAEAHAVVACEVLHSRGGGKNSPPPP